MEKKKLFFKLLSSYTLSYPLIPSKKKKRTPGKWPKKNLLNVLKCLLKQPNLLPSWEKLAHDHRTLVTECSSREWTTLDHLGPSSALQIGKQRHLLSGLCKVTLLVGPLHIFLSALSFLTLLRTPFPKPQTKTVLYLLCPSTYITMTPPSNEKVGIIHISLLGDRKDPSGSQVQLIVSGNDRIHSLVLLTAESLLLTSK